MSQCCIKSAFTITWSQKLVCVWPAQILPPFSKAKTGKYLKLSHDIQCRGCTVEAAKSMIGPKQAPPSFNPTIWVGKAGR